MWVMIPPLSILRFYHKVSSTRLKFSRTIEKNLCRRIYENAQSQNQSQKLAGDFFLRGRGLNIATSFDRKYLDKAGPRRFLRISAFSRYRLERFSFRQSLGKGFVIEGHTFIVFNAVSRIPPFMLRRKYFYFSYHRCAFFVCECHGL